MTQLHLSWQHFRSGFFKPGVDRSLFRAVPAKPSRQRVLTFASITGVISATVFVDSQVLVAAGAAIWAIGGYFNLSLLPFGVLALLIGLPAVWACIIVAVLAYEAETDPENN